MMRSANADICSPPPGATSSPATNASIWPGNRVMISAVVRPSQAPTWNSRQAGSGRTSFVRTDAVCIVRSRSDAMTTSAGRGEIRARSRSSCARPAPERPESKDPCQRRSLLAFVSACRMRVTVLARRYSPCNGRRLEACCAHQSPHKTLWTYLLPAEPK